MLTRAEVQTSESYIIGAMLAVVGGFLDAYSYLFRGHVFANAQTGNIVLLGLNIEQHNYSKAFVYFAPICAFVAGVILVEFIKRRLKYNQKVHWRQGIVVIEIIGLLVVGFLKPGVYDTFANIVISFVCAMQVETFRKIHGHPFASTMCTGNLRSGTQALFEFFDTRNSKYKVKALKYYGIIFIFILGAVLGGFLITLMGQYSIFVCCGILLIVCGMMFQESFGGGN